MTRSLNPHTFPGGLTYRPSLLIISGT